MIMSGSQWKVVKLVRGEMIFEIMVTFQNISAGLAEDHEGTYSIQKYLILPQFLLT